MKNFAEMKRAIAAKRPFVIKKHYIKPEFEGQIRVPNKVQTNACYTVVKDDPENPINKANGGLGYYFQYGKASDWKFEDGRCIKSFMGRLVWEIEFV